MPESVAKKTEVIADGGFRIVIEPDELTVTADKTAWKSRARSSRIYYAIALSLFFLAIIFVNLDKPGNDFAIGLIACAVLVTPGLLISYMRGAMNLHCTRDNLEVIRVARGQVRDVRAFSRSSAKQIRFDTVAYSRYRAINAIVFDGAQSTVKTLRGIESPEAQTILRELRRLGYETVQDVGMPMMSEMALERRNSWLSWFWQ